MAQRITRVAGDPPQLPITIEQAKAHIRSTSDTEDEILETYINAALEWAEERTNRAIAQRSYLVVNDKFPLTGWWALPLGYVDSITSVQYIDTNGATQTWSSANYELDNASDYQARLRPVPAQSWPSIGEYLSAARVTMVAGWAVDDVPYTVRQAVLMMVANFDEGRAPGDPDGMHIERAAEALLSAWRLPFFGRIQ